MVSRGCSREENTSSWVFLSVFVTIAPRRVIIGEEVFKLLEFI